MAGDSRERASVSLELGRLLDGVLDGVAIVRQSDGAIVYSNGALRELLGVSAEDLDAVIREHLRGGRTGAVDLTHHDLGAIRLVVFPRDPRRSAERAWRRDLGRELGRARRRSGAVAVAAIALDGGGGTQPAAVAWSKVLRAEDSLTPHEGGVYLAVLADCTLEGAHCAADRIRDATPAPATVSIGLAAWGKDEQLESLVSRAFDALARAQAAGGNQTAAAPDPGGGRM